MLQTHNNISADPSEFFFFFFLLWCRHIQSEISSTQPWHLAFCDFLLSIIKLKHQPWYWYDRCNCTALQRSLVSSSDQFASQRPVWSLYCISFPPDPAPNVANERHSAAQVGHTTKDGKENGWQTIKTVNKLKLWPLNFNNSLQFYPRTLMSEFLLDKRSGRFSVRRETSIACRTV